jgi:signal peptidase I
MTRRNWPLIACLLALPVIAVIRGRFLVVAVRGSSMAPIYHDGDTLLAVRLSRSHAWRAGEDLVFARTGQPIPGDPSYLVKRICAVSGDPVPDQAEDLMANRASCGRIPSGWLLLQGMKSGYFYSVPVDAVVGKIVGRVRASAQGGKASTAHVASR